MNAVTSTMVTSRLNSVFINNTYSWNTYGEQAWSEMMTLLHKQPAHLRIMGIDSEWYRNSPLAVVQLATASHCFVLHLSYMNERRLPDAVKEALNNPSVIKCGVGVSGDVSRLEKEQSFTVKSIMDVAHYSVFLGLHDAQQSNLKVLAASVANLQIEKNKYITRSNWELELTPSQINYAAEDALASYLIGETIMRKACELYHVDTRDFNVSAWLKSTATIAAQFFKKMQQEKARKANDRMKEEARMAAVELGNNILAIQSGSEGRVAVLDKAGRFLFECSPGRAKFYVMEKGLAKITKHVKGDPHKALEIQLLFDPKVKTRLCMYNSLGACELRDQCPFAHGVDELQPESRTLLSSREPSCAFCLGTRGLLRHAVTPPSFRKYLPPPYRYPQEDDFKPVCGQCNSILRHFYDVEMRKCYTEAASFHKDTLNLDIVVKCVSYARLLSSDDKIKKIPLNRQEELRNYICKNWKRTYFRDFYPDFVFSEPLELNSDFLKRLEKIMPGEVRSRVTVDILVGSDQEKAKAFVQRWRDFCFQTCGMVEKESNHMSYGDWKTYRAHSNTPPEDTPGTADKENHDEAEA